MFKRVSIKISWSLGPFTPKSLRIIASSMEFACQFRPVDPLRCSPAPHSSQIWNPVFFRDGNFWSTSMAGPLVPHGTMYTIHFNISYWKFHTATRLTERDKTLVFVANNLLEVKQSSRVLHQIYRNVSCCDYIWYRQNYTKLKSVEWITHWPVVFPFVAIFFGEISPARF